MRKASLYLLLGGSIAFYLLDPLVKVADKNFLPSDIFFIMSALVLFLDDSGFSRFRKELMGNVAMGPFLVFIVASLVGFLINASERAVNPGYYFFSALQLIFNFVLLYPLVQSHKDDILNAKKLWSVHLYLIPFAGLLSVTDYVGLTGFGEISGERHFNVLLVSNGFWLFGVVSAFLLQKLFPFRAAAIGFAGLWLLACAGTMLAGTKTTMVVVALSILFVVWLQRKAIFRDVKFFAGFALFLLVAGSAAWMLQTFSAVLDRVQETRDYIETGNSDESAANRLNQIQTVLNDWRREPLALMGRGFKQYTIIHPEDRDLSVHNMYLQQIYDAGIIGLLAFLLVFWRLFSRTLTCYRYAHANGDSQTANYWACCMFVIATYLISGLVGQIGYYRHYWLPLFLATPSVREYAQIGKPLRFPAKFSFFRLAPQRIIEKDTLA
jgi:hypothetical protein